MGTREPGWNVQSVALSRRRSLTSPANHVLTVGITVTRTLHLLGFDIGAQCAVNSFVETIIQPITDNLRILYCELTKEAVMFDKIHL